MAKPDPSSEELGAVQDAITFRPFRMAIKRILPIDVDLQRRRRLTDLADDLKYVVSIDSAWISHIVDAEWGAALPQLETGAHAVVQMGKGINCATGGGILQL